MSKHKHNPQGREKAAKAAKAPAVQRPDVDFPQQGEKVTGLQYTLRVSAPAEAGRVELSVDQGDWRPCRESVGYWWFDWADYGPGEHEFTARVHTLDGRVLLSEPRQCVVELPLAL